MADNEYVYNENGSPMTLAQAREMIREEWTKAEALYGPTAPAAPAAPAPPVDAAEAQRQATRQALADADAAREAKRNLAASVREQFAEQHGFRIDSMPDDEALKMAGLSDKPPTAAEECAQRTREQECEVLTNPAAAAAYEHERAVARFTQRYWGLAQHQREAQAAALGIDLATFTPPTRLFG
jgi:hypothetical protein